MEALVLYQTSVEKLFSWLCFMQAGTKKKFFTIVSEVVPASFFSYQ
jgi:hypothetical protein